MVFVLTILFSGCDSDSTTFNQKSTTSKNKQECTEPQNPYGDGGGHDAGFKWAMENGGECNGNSDSFNQGCAEYYRQLEQYNGCIANSRQ
jgi:hypothetical protein